MKKFLYTFCFLLCAVGASAQSIPARPSPPKLVNDFTNTLTPDQIASLERKLVAYDDSTSNQIAIVIINTTNDYDLADYATKLGRAWGVGNKKTNNGVVVLVAKGDRKVFIAPGYGLEGAIPDITAKTIVDNDILPNFKENDFYRGLELGTNSIMKAATGEYKAPEGYNKKKSKGKDGGSILGVIIIFFIVMLLARRGGGGRGGGGMVSRRGYGDLLTGAILGNILSGGRRGGGGFGGGGFGGGSSGGGGFGGFGGGSFGGGGSGGSW